jgi:two-component system OmpR family sensor kinase
VTVASEPAHRRRPLRDRLTVGLVVIVATVLTVVGVAILLLLRNYLFDQLDTQLADAAHQAPAIRLDDKTTYQGLPANTIVVPYFNGQLSGHPILISYYDQDDTGRSDQLTNDEITTLATIGTHPSTVRLTGLGRYRVQMASSGSASWVVGLPTEQVDATLRTVAAVEVVGLLVALLLVIGLGRWLIRRELHPLEEVAATARQVGSLPLQQADPTVPYRVTVRSDSQEVDEVATAFNEMLEHVDESLRRRARNEDQLRQFVADASHELRTPLASVRGYAELYRRVDEPDRRDSAVARIESEAQRMSVLVDDLLLLARLDQGRPLDRQPVDLARLVADTAADVQVTSDDHVIQVDVPAEPTLVIGDADRLQQVVVNLLANAVQHTPEGTRITAAVAADDAEDGLVTVVVTDDGPGMSQATLQRAFERFARGDESRTRRRGGGGGSGLGLAIVAAVVASHGGQVDLGSGPQGTTVTVTLPAAVDSDPASVQPTAPGAGIDGSQPTSSPTAAPPHVAAPLSGHEPDPTA